MIAPTALRPIVIGALLLFGNGIAPAGEILDRRYVPIPPIYPAPPPGFLPLPASGTPPVIRDPGAPPDRPAWSPGRLEVVVGIDGKGRITHGLEYTPSRFDR